MCLQVVKIIKMIRLKCRYENEHGRENCRKMVPVLAHFGNEVAFPLHERQIGCRTLRHLPTPTITVTGNAHSLRMHSTEGSGGGLAMHAANQGGIGGH